MAYATKGTLSYFPMQLRVLKISVYLCIIYHPVIFKELKGGGGSQCAICTDSCVTLNMEHPCLSLAVLAFDPNIICKPWQAYSGKERGKRPIVVSNADKLMPV